jgi:quercetin dioxygenase-like cupin family protein
MVRIVTEGEGNLSCGVDPVPVRAGETWLLPGAGEHWHGESNSPHRQVLVAQPPG